MHEALPALCSPHSKITILGFDRLSHDTVRNILPALRNPRSNITQLELGNLSSETALLFPNSLWTTQAERSKKIQIKHTNAYSPELVNTLRTFNAITYSQMPFQPQQIASFQVETPTPQQFLQHQRQSHLSNALLQPPTQVMSVQPQSAQSRDTSLASASSGQSVSAINKQPSHAMADSEQNPKHKRRGQIQLPRNNPSTPSKKHPLFLGIGGSLIPQ